MVAVSPSRFEIEIGNTPSVQSLRVFNFGKKAVEVKVSLATWDDQRNQLANIDPLNRSTSFTYNQWGKELTITDAKGVSYRNNYDSVGNLSYISDPLGFAPYVNNINSEGLITRMWDTFSSITDYTYDADGNRLTETDPLGNVTTMTYDDNGNVLTETVQRTFNGILTDETTSFEYDALDRLVKTTDPLGNITQQVYDEVGNKVQDIDALGRITRYSYDPYRRLTRTDHLDGSFTTMVYDAEGNLTSETDTNGNTTSFAYDALNRLTVTTYPSSSTTRTAYDAIGRVVSETDERGGCKNRIALTVRQLPRSLCTMQLPTLLATPVKRRRST